jgi:uncharacterized protein (TIGR00266 family)
VRHRIEYGPAFTWLRLRLAKGESIDAEAGSMVARSTGLQMTSRLNAGRDAGPLRLLWALIVAFARRTLGGETLFINTFTADGDAELALAPAMSGDIVRHRLAIARPPLVVQSGAYLASTPGVDAALMFGGLRGLLSGNGLFFLRCTGEGELFLNSYGGIHEVRCQGSYIVDTGHLVAFEGQLDMRIRGAAKGLTGLLASGEGLVCELNGDGRIWIQSRNIASFASWINPNL